MRIRIRQGIIVGVQILKFLIHPRDTLTNQKKAQASTQTHSCKHIMMDLMLVNLVAEAIIVIVIVMTTGTTMTIKLDRADLLLVTLEMI